MDDSLVLLKRAINEFTINWNSRLLKIEAALKKDDKSQKKSESKSNTISEVIEEILEFEINSNHYQVEENNITSHLSQHSLASESEVAFDHDFEHLNDSDMSLSGKCYLSVPHTQSDLTDSDSDALDDCQYSVTIKMLIE